MLDAALGETAMRASAAAEKVAGPRKNAIEVKNAKIRVKGMEQGIQQQSPKEKVQALEHYIKGCDSPMMKGAENKPEAEMILFILSGGDFTVDVLQQEMMMKIQEVKEANLGPEAAQKKMMAIEKQYSTLMNFSGERQRKAEGLVKKMEKSKDPSERVNGFDLHIALTQSQIDENTRRIIQYGEYLKAGNDGRAYLTKDQKEEYQRIITILARKNQELHTVLGNNEQGEVVGDGLIKQRTALESYEKHPDAVKALANTFVIDETVKLEDGTVVPNEKLIEFAQEHPASYLKDMMSKAVSSQEGADYLVGKLKNAKILNTEKDVLEFQKYIKLVADYKKEMATKAGNIAMGTSLFALLMAYIAYKQSQSEGQGMPH